MKPKMLTKREWLALGRVFEAEIDNGRLLQSKALIYADELEPSGLVAMTTRVLDPDRFGSIKVTGWGLTLIGHYQYCAECERYGTEDV